jgi:hypothetical protein
MRLTVLSPRADTHSRSPNRLGSIPGLRIAGMVIDTRCGVDSGDLVAGVVRDVEPVSVSVGLMAWERAPTSLLVRW